MIIAVALFALVGLALGLLGGGGSILAVPALIYGLGLEPKRAIATSLLIVATTSLAGMLSHARAGRVLWRAGALFGGAGMVGAFAGGRIARFLPPGILLAGFSVAMVVTAAAMLRPPRRDLNDDKNRDNDNAVPAGARSLPRLLVAGAAVGLLTGTVGAGGGFVIVPALVLLLGLPMKLAVGTSLLVIAMNALAGFAGYVGHVDIDYRAAAIVTPAAVLATVAGERLARLVPRDLLRRGFGWLLLVVAASMIAHALPASVRESAIYRAVLVDRWPFWAGGLGVGGLALAMLWIDNKLLGVSTGCAEICQIPRTPSVARSWRLPFLGGIVLGGVVAGLFAGGGATLSMGAFDTLFSSHLAVKLPLLAGAGVLIGYGARAAGGCTSGHGIVGVAQLSRASLAATAAFLAGGFVTTQLLVRVLGGVR